MLNLTSLTASHLITPLTPIISAAQSDPRSVLPAKFFNDLDILSTSQGDGMTFRIRTVFKKGAKLNIQIVAFHVFLTKLLNSGEVVVFSDSSYSFSRSENRIEVLDGAPRGRLFAFSLATKELRVSSHPYQFPIYLSMISYNNVEKIKTNLLKHLKTVFINIH